MQMKLQKVAEYKRRIEKKVEIINAGLCKYKDCQEKLVLEAKFTKAKHEEDNGNCIWCGHIPPFAESDCSFRYHNVSYTLHIPGSE